jgi:hypothetical protein
MVVVKVSAIGRKREMMRAMGLTMEVGTMRTG